MPITTLQGPAGGAGGAGLIPVDLRKVITQITTWTDEGDAPRLRGIQVEFQGGETQTFGEQPSGTAEDDESFTGSETFTRLDVFPTTAIGGRVAGFVLYWTDSGGANQKQFGVRGDLATAQFNVPGCNIFGQILISSGLDIDAMGVLWVATGC